VTIDKGQWQVAGSAPEVYEHDLVPAVFGPWAPRVVGLADPQPGERVLDVACGTGVVARLAAERVGERGTVVAADLNPGMLAVPARSRVHPTPRSTGGKPTPLRFRSQTRRSTLRSVNSAFSSSPTARPRCARCTACCAQAVASSSWSGARSRVPPASHYLQKPSSRISGQMPPQSCELPSRWATPRSFTSLIEGAGFESIDLRADTGTVRFASVKRFVASYVTGSPLAGPVAAAPPEARDALLAEVYQVAFVDEQLRCLVRHEPRDVGQQTGSTRTRPHT
jgi:Methyltransferase domain